MNDQGWIGLSGINIYRREGGARIVGWEGVFEEGMGGK